MTVKKSRVENVAFVIATCLTLAGVGLVVAGLFVPYWYETETKMGVVKIKFRTGLWRYEVCNGLGGCSDEWNSDVEPAMPSGETIRIIETMSACAGVLALAGLLIMWGCRRARYVLKMTSHILFFAPVMISAFLAVTGTLIIASKGDKDLIKWAPFLSGIGGALLFMAGCLTCVVCRFDPSYGTLDNPVSPTFMSP